MPVEIDLTFATSFSLEELAELPQNPPLRQVYYPDATAGTAFAELWLLVQPVGQEAWVAVIGRTDGVFGLEDTVIALPDGRSFVAVHDGRGFVIDAHDPAAVSDLEVCPVRHARVCAEHERVVLGGYDVIAAYGPHGVAWLTERITFDFLGIDEVVDGTLHARASSSSVEEEATIKIDLATGAWTSTDPNAPFPLPEQWEPPVRGETLLQRLLRSPGRRRR